MICHKGVLEKIDDQKGVCGKSQQPNRMYCHLIANITNKCRTIAKGALFDWCKINPAKPHPTVQAATTNPSTKYCSRPCPAKILMPRFTVQHGVFYQHDNNSNQR